MPSPDTTPTNPALNPDPINIDQNEAARLTGLSAKTLERLAKAGEPVGRFRVGNRVLFHLPTLRTWFANRVSVNRTGQIL
jgi:phage terminase Nu1 subunit (DNA packaging protein)